MSDKNNYLPFWGLCSRRAALYPRNRAQVVAHFAQLCQPRGEERIVSFSLGPQCDVAVKEANDLIQQESLGSCKALRRGRHEADRFGGDELTRTLVQGAHDHGRIGGGAVGVEHTGGKAGDDTLWGMSAVEEAMQKWRCIAGCHVCHKVLDAVCYVI